MTKDQNLILREIPMPIITDRLVIRPAMPGDGAAVHEAKVETFEQLNQWMPWAKNHETIEYSEKICREAYAKFIQREDMMMFAFDRKTNKFISGTGLHRFDWSVRRFEIGYWVRASEQGKGYATEIANALTRYAFGALDARAVTIGHAEGNKTSKRVITKLGFDYEGCERLGLALPNGDIVDAHNYSRIDMKNLPDLKIQWGTDP